jgi:LuxR family transcriptional regulator, quorum-sensing system regulator CciR
MTDIVLAERIAGLLNDATCERQLFAALEEATAELGFSYFALAQHIPKVKERGFRLHSYPETWEQIYDAQDLSITDPVHRASQRTSIGFAWADLPRLIPLTTTDRRILARARGRGLGDGFTVPAHVPGEVNGSCTFAMATGRSLPTRALPVAQLTGAFAFEAARRIWQQQTRTMLTRVELTDRQRDCVLWMAQGKSDWAISRILGIGTHTVSQHLHQARERMGVDNRTSLAVWALYDGIISFNDVIKR